MLKRLFDLFFALIVVIALAPVLGLIAILVKLSSPGSVLFRGARVGLYGRPFYIFKFRTMVEDADRNGASSTPDDDPRITRLGKWLRDYKLDELPQFFNVLRGEMSLVGPRPQVQWAVDLYSPEERSLLTVRPGITDYASLVFRDEGAILRGSPDPDKTYLEKIAPEKIRLGLEYVKNQSLLIDIQIIVATAGVIMGIVPGWCLPRKQRSLDSTHQKIPG